MLKRIKVWIQRIAGTRAKRYRNALVLAQALQGLLKGKTDEAVLIALSAFNVPAAATLKGVLSALQTALPELIKILEVIDNSDNKLTLAENVDHLVKFLLDKGYADHRVYKAVITIEKALADNKITILEAINIINLIS